MVRFAYHFSRIVFGAWFLYSGLWHFFWPWLQPMGTTPEAIAFTQALLASGLFTAVKAIEVVTGITLLLNRAVPLTVVALAPINVVIIYWNVVLDRGLIDWIFTILTVVFSLIIAWPWRRYFWPLFVWKSRPDYSLQPRIERDPFTR